MKCINSSKYLFKVKLKEKGTQEKKERTGYRTWKNGITIIQFRDSDILEFCRVYVKVWDR